MFHKPWLETPTLNSQKKTEANLMLKRAAKGESLTESQMNFIYSTLGIEKADSMLDIAEKQGKLSKTTRDNFIQSSTRANGLGKNLSKSTSSSFAQDRRDDYQIAQSNKMPLDPAFEKTAYDREFDLKANYANKTEIRPNMVVAKDMPNRPSNQFSSEDSKAFREANSATYTTPEQNVFEDRTDYARGVQTFANPVVDYGGSAGEFSIAGSTNSPQYTGGSSSGPAPLVLPENVQLNTKGLDIGTGGEGSIWDSSFYKNKEGTLMKDGGMFGDDTIANQADIDAGIKDQNASPWGSAAGWEAAGTVMKGVGGLASAYTGMKNYQLARDAFNEQKRQWDANYGMQLKSYNTGIDQYNQKQQDKLSWRKRTGMGDDANININANDLAKV